MQGDKTTIQLLAPVQKKPRITLGCSRIAGKDRGLMLDIAPDQQMTA